MTDSGGLEMLRNLWVMRHGLAVDNFDTDFSRELSAFGAEQAKNVAQQVLSESKSLPTHMLVSPFSRTQSTAAIVHECLGLSQPFKTEELLVHFGDHQLLADFLLASHYENLILVSHMPIVASLCQTLAPNSNVYGFETAQIVHLEFSIDKDSKVNSKLVKTYLSNL